MNISLSFLQTTVNISSQLGSFFAITKVGPLISGILAASLTLAALAFILYFIWGAMRWLTAGSDKTQVELARQKITNAFIGLVLVAAAWAIYLLVIYVLGLGGIISTANGNGDDNGVPAGYCGCYDGDCMPSGGIGPIAYDGDCYICDEGTWEFYLPADDPSCPDYVDCPPCP